MSQYPTFYEYHGENGIKFKQLIIDNGLLDNKVGFPISAVNDQLAITLYTNFICAKVWIKSQRKSVTKDQFVIYNRIKTEYLSYIHKYHVRGYPC